MVSAASPDSSTTTSFARRPTASTRRPAIASANASGVCVRSVRGHEQRAPVIVAPDDARAQVARDGLDLGQLGHRRDLAERRRERRLGSAASSASAAIASARVSGVIDSQSSPTLMSTVSGTSSGSALSIVSRRTRHQPVDLVARHLEQQLVVDLEQRPRAEAAGAQPLVEPDHRDLDDVGGGALDRHVDGHPLAGGAQGRVARRELRDLRACARAASSRSPGVRACSLIASM